MSDLSVKEIELGTVTNKLKFYVAKIIELEDQIKSREVFLGQLNVFKERVEYKLAQVKLKVIGKPSLKGSNI
jgi:hypothetical protein